MCRTQVSFLEFSFNGGPSTFGNDLFSTQQFILGVPPVSLDVPANTSLASRWGFAVKSTFNPHPRISHEVGYTYNRTTFEASFVDPTDPRPLTAPAAIRQFDYNLLIHFKPIGSRVRPYAAIGPGMQLIRITETPVRSGRLPFRAFRGLSRIADAWDFGSRPPLDGGGSFK